MSQEPVAPHRPTVTYANITVSAPFGFRPLQMDLHLPQDRPGPHPVALWIHGGGFNSGSRLQLPDSIAPHRFHERMLQRGYAVADVDYRLTGEAIYPAQLIDTQAAIGWLRRNAERVNVDPTRFATIGESAGGHLAVMAGLLGEGDTAVQAVVNWYGVVAFDAFPGNDDPTSAAVMFLGGPVSDRVDFARWASPLYRVHAGAPPCLSIHGEVDELVPAEQSERLTKALNDLGVTAELIVVPGADHCFVGHDDIGGLIEAGADFLDRVLQ